MGREIIRVSNSAYSRYEELLMKRDAVKKEAFQLEQEYIRVFGDLILEVFQRKLDCIRKKKTIQYCQAFINRGEGIDREALQAYLLKEMAEYQAKLNDMIEENNAAKDSRRVSEGDLLKIKRIYHRLVKMIHPDINPVTADNEELMDLWQRLVIAYNCNDLKEMQEVEVLVNALLDKLDMGGLDVFIPDIDKKIADLEAEIQKIISRDPYQYKYLLSDRKAVAEKKETLTGELKEYEEYSSRLDETLDGILGKGVKITWRMN